MQTRSGKIADWAAALLLLCTGGGVSGGGVWHHASGIIAGQEAQLRLANDVIAAAKTSLAAAGKREQALQARLDRAEAALAVKPVPPPARMKVKPATVAPPKVKPAVVADPAAVASGLAPVGRVDPAAMVAAHNRWRAGVGVPGLKWSVDLADKAQAWAQHLAASNCETEHSGNGSGENIYKAGPMVWTDGRREVWSVPPRQVVDHWGEERAQWDNATGRCSGVCGHYTQVVWKDTKEVGCGMAVCGSKAQIWVCNYSPAGNVVGQNPY